MDFSVFSDENFDVKDWINSAFLTEEASKNKEPYVGTLVMKLQLFIQEINNSLEETGHQVLHSVPRVLRDVEAIQQESILLRDQMRAVKEEIKKVEHDTAQSMQTLIKIDTVKNRMIDTNKALQEADNWTNLSSDVEEVFLTGDIAKIAEKLVGMQQSLEILTDVSDYEDRCLHLEKLKDKLEAIVSPQLIAALNSHSLDLAQVYVAIFKDINRVDQFWKYYHKCYKAQLLDEWRKIVNNDQDETLLDWLSAFYDKLLSTWHSQIRWCQQAVVSSCPVQVMCVLFSDALNNLDPSIKFCMNSALKNLNPNATLYLLSDLKQVSDRFTKSLQTLISNVDQSSTVSEYVRKFVCTVYEPYKESISRFGEIEEKILIEHLQPLDMVREDALDSVRFFYDSIGKVVGFMNEACEHCKHLTAGCSYVTLVTALTSFFQEYVKKVYKVVDQLKVHVEAIVSNDDWSIFQQTLQATQSCGDLLIKVENVEQDLVTAILEMGRHTGLPVQSDLTSRCNSLSNNPFTDHKDLLLDERGQKAMRQLIHNVQQDANYSVLRDIIAQIQRLCETFSKLLFTMMFDPINKQLSGITTMQVWAEKKSGSALTDDLPTFSMSPQEYITQIGQHLITLPQHIEPFVVDDNPALQLALKNGKLPYILEQHSSHLTDVLLGSVALGTAQTYSDTIIRIPHLTSTSVKQLITDIEYLCNVLDDLGLKPGDNDSLQIILSLLTASQDQYTIVSHGKPAHLVNAIRRIRDL